jgi:hypothetical protein
MTIAGKFDLIIQQGATFDLEMTLKQENGNPINLTGYEARMQIRTRHSAQTAMLEITTDEDGGITFPDPATGKIVIEIPAETTAELKAIKAAVYDLELIEPQGKVRRVVEGTVTITPEVTR